ncbi:MAG: hypothetical protein EBR99_02185, partial [Actinobacteria bacterium]|nr:hypothetical protein [Actinomycetota bacterium]
IVDEADRANGDVLSLLLAFCDSTASSVFVRPDTGEVIRPHADFSAIITSNVESKDDLPPALSDRFPVSLVINEAHPHAIATLPVDLQALAVSLVSAPAGRRASLRAVTEFANIRGAIGETRALRLVFGAELATSIEESIKVARMVEVL